jgi:hypothetical protein
MCQERIGNPRRHLTNSLQAFAARSKNSVKPEAKFAKIVPHRDEQPQMVKPGSPVSGVGQRASAAWLEPDIKI